MYNKRENVTEIRKTKQGTEWYRERIVEMVRQIEDLGTLQYLHKFIELFKEKWG